MIGGRGNEHEVSAVPLNQSTEVGGHQAGIGELNNHPTPVRMEVIDMIGAQLPRDMKVSQSRFAGSKHIQRLQ